MSDAALSDLFVLEYAEGVAGPFCGKAFADLGADVVKVESPRGDRSRAVGPFPGDVPHRERSGQFLYNNANKRGITLDLERGSERQDFLDLAASADILIIDLPPLRLRDLDLDYAHLQVVNNQLIVTCISPFGQTGPYGDYRSTELTTFHIGGMGRETPYNQVTNLAQEPPLKAGGYQASYLTGWTAATATMVALHHRAVYGSGQLVDIAEMEAVASMLRYTFASLSHDPNGVWPRQKIGFPWILPCKDGHVSFSPFHFDHWWAGFKDMMEHPAWAEAEMFSTMAGRLQYADALETLSIQWMMGHTKAELYAMALQRGLPCFPANSIPEVVHSRQFGVRNFFVTVAHPEAGAVTQPGPPYRLHGTPWRIARPAPCVGEHNAEVLARGLTCSGCRTEPGPPARSADPQRNRPFAGLRVAEFGWALAVPHATAWLGSLGAEVIRIESRTRLDLTRLSPAGVADGVPGVNRSAFFNGVNYSKKSVTLNLSHPEGIALAKALVKHTDIVAENFSVGTMDKLGLGYEALKSIRPDIIVLSGTPLGRDGPERFATGWGPNTQAYAGLPYITGYENGAPAGIGGNWPDYMIGTAMVFALLAALRHRQRTGQGQLVEFSMAETVATMIPEAILDYTMNGRDGHRLGNRHPLWAPQGVYPCSGEDAWVAIAIQSDEEWQALCRFLGNPAWASDTRFDTAAGRRRAHDEIDQRLADWTRSRTHYEVMHVLQSAGIAAAPCLDVRELTTDPQLRERKFLIEIDHHEVGKRLVAGLPARMSNVAAFDYLPAPLLGEHNRDVFCGLLGLSPDELEQLVQRQVVF
jgi:crotonobetainyl-CoA:carnitine CoA-transferase CaiB-like acyl-CoA transferase